MMKARVSRRAFLTTVGAGAVAVASAAAVWNTRGCSAARPRGSPATGSRVNFADFEGWMLTVADKQKLVGRVPSGRP